MPDDVVRPASSFVELPPDDHRDVAREIHHLKIDDGDSNEDSEISSAYPDRPDAPDCLYYMRTGSCGYGNNCRYNHPPLSSQDGKLKDLPERAGQPDCGYYLKTGTCKYGFTCKYHHPKDRIGNGPASFNARQEEKACPHYMRYGQCKFGATCRFHHPPQPSQKPTFSFPYVTALPTWAFSRTPYELHDPRATNCFPFVFVPISSGSTFADNDGLLPQRPDQPECRYFMNNGTCKYGSECKFHHPKERIPNLLGPHGLPSRPGELVCAGYSSNGFCKYGSTCRFDHPLLGYSYGYHFGVPAYPSDWGFVPREAQGIIRNVVIADEGSPEPADSSNSGPLVNLSHATA